MGNSFCVFTRRIPAQKHDRYAPRCAPHTCFPLGACPQSLFRGDLLDTGDIEEVDMDAETDVDPAPQGSAAAAATKRPLYESDDDGEHSGP